MVELLIYDRWGAQIGALSPITCTRAEEINGEDTLTFTTPVRLEKGDRALFQDDSGQWHEHVVTEAEELRETADVLCTYVADNSLCETMGDYLEDVRNQNMTAAGALAKALAVTRWGRKAPPLRSARTRRTSTTPTPGLPSTRWPRHGAAR